MPFNVEQKELFDVIYEKSLKLSEGDKLVSLVYEMIDLARQGEMGNDIRVPPHQMGIHPRNRQGKK